jgi:hypothetical protein
MPFLLDIKMRYSGSKKSDIENSKSEIKTIFLIDD